jgi:hypothetical protein
MSQSEVFPDQKQIAKDLLEGSGRLNSLATEVSIRVDNFEEWLNNLPGKVAVECFESVPSSPANKTLLGLAFARDGRRWKLDVGYKPIDGKGEQEWTTLTEAGLDTKCRAIKLFGNLLAVMLKKQRQQTEKFENACAEFDSFAVGLGIGNKKKEGK